MYSKNNMWPSLVASCVRLLICEQWRTNGFKEKGTNIVELLAKKNTIDFSATPIKLQRNCCEYSFYCLDEILERFCLAFTLPALRLDGALTRFLNQAKLLYSQAIKTERLVLPSSLPGLMGVVGCLMDNLVNPFYLKKIICHYQSTIKYMGFYYYKHVIILCRYN